MTKRTTWTWALAALLCAPLSAVAEGDSPETDLAGCKDHPLVSRPPGFYLTECEQQDFGEHAFPLKEDVKRVEGTRFRLVYSKRAAIHVVGHTDNQGGLDSNLKLSRNRAESVVKALSSRHGIAAARLKSTGVGPLCPVGSNRDEPGRARNRRVELVEQ